MQNINSIVFERCESSNVRSSSEAAKRSKAYHADAEENMNCFALFCQFKPYYIHAEQIKDEI